MDKKQRRVSIIWSSESGGPSAVDIAGQMSVKTGLSWFPLSRPNSKEERLGLLSDTFVEVSRQARTVHFELWEQFHTRSFILIDGEPIDIYCAILEVRVDELETAANVAVDELKKTRSFFGSARFQRIRLILEAVMKRDSFMKCRNKVVDLHIR